MNREIPDGYERVSDDNHLTLHHEAAGIFITVTELDEAEKAKFDRKYTHRVAASDQHKPIYGVACESQSRAEDKAFELAEARP